MKTCIYCGRSKPDEEFSDEHIWPDGLGGDFLPPLWMSDDVCRTCNNLSGLYVDGSFIKGWAGAAERATGAREYLNRAGPKAVILPLDYIGRLRDIPVREGEVAEYWAGPCGANIIHIRPDDVDDHWSAYAGGDPRAKKLAAGRAYMSLTSSTPFWIAVSLNSFRAHFKKAARFITNAEVPPEWTDLFRMPDPNNPIQTRDLLVVNTVVEAGRTGQSLRLNASIPFDAGARLLAKLALGIGYKLLGRDFLQTPYAATLRQGLWERDINARRSIPVRGSGYFGGHDFGPAAPVMCQPGGWVLLVKVTAGDLSLSIFTPSGKTMCVLISDDNGLIDQLDPAYREGQLWLTIPSLGAGLGPIWLPDYIAHRINEIANPALSALEAKKTDPAKLPPC